MRLLIAALAIALMMASAQAQIGGQAGQNAARAQQQQKEKSASPKVDDKAYNAALHTLPNKQYDPWHGVR